MTIQQNDESQTKPKPISLKDDETWHDITHRIQSESIDFAKVDNIVIPVNFSPEFTEVTLYFRTVLQMEEISLRVLNLTKRVISKNPFSYSAWCWRRKCLFKLVPDCVEEIGFMDKLMEDLPKNYQTWFHRKSLLLHYGCNDIEKEILFLNNSLNREEKNYHAWSYRRWFVRQFGIVEREIAYTEKMIKDDEYNNSAWNHRFYAVTDSKSLNKTDIMNEIKFAIQSIERYNDNESSWSYLDGMIEKYKEFSNGETKELIEVLKEFLVRCGFCETDENGTFKILSKENNNALAFLVETLQHLTNTSCCSEAFETLLKTDVTHQTYWKFLQELNKSQQ